MLIPVGARTAVHALSSSIGLGSLPSICPLQLTTGHACPLCGLTRAVGSLVSGDVTAAVDYHPMSIVLSFQVAAVVFFAARRSRLGATRRSGSSAATASTTFALARANALMFLVVWIVRWRFNLLDAAIGT